VIDYTYLWDIICTPNPALFKEGINLVILEVANNDITDNVNLICPTNHYNSVIYDPAKPTLILFHQDEYFEPIYTYKTEKNPKNKEDVLYVGKLFREQDIRLSEQIKYLFDYVIKPYYKNMCAPFASMPKVYKVKHAMILQDMVNILNENNYTIRSQVVNYQGKVIGIIADISLPTITSGFIPCYPSALLPGIDYTFMMEPSIWKPYYETIAFLKNVYKNTFGKVPCNPIFKIIEDEVVVGVLTETNQFVQLSVPIPVSEIKDDTLREIRDNNYVVNKDATPLISSDSIITMSNKIDQERENYVKKIKLETSLYQLFRTTIRMLLNDYSKLELREEIENVTKSPFAIYSEKLKRTTELLRRLVDDMVIFVKDYDYKLINELTTCAMNKTADKCNANAPLCAFTINGKCQLIIPKENLLTRSDNEKNYFLKMADELVRYNRIKSFMFEKQTYLSFGKVDYNLYDDEFIILQSLITQEYFEELVPTKQNRFIKYNSYDEAKPIISQTYVDEVKLPRNK
jgi:ribosome biogenesis protein Nip4